MATIVVTTNADSGAGSLRQAIADAVPGDTITFDPSLAGSTITLASQISLSGIEIDLEIIGLVDANGAPAITLSGANAYRIFYFWPSEFKNPPSMSVSNLIFENSIAGAYTCYNMSKHSITNCIFRNNTSSSNTGACAIGSPVTITDCVFSGNSNTSTGTNYPAALSISTSMNQRSSILKNCTFENNTAGNASYPGAAIKLDHGKFVISSCRFIGQTGNTWDVYIASSWSNSPSSSDPSSPDISYTNVELVGNLDFNSGILVRNYISNVTSGGTTYSGWGRTTIINYGYNGIRRYKLLSGTNTDFTGSGFLALSSSASVTLPETITRIEYGAGVSNLVSNNLTLSWTSTDSTKSVLLEKENGSTWDMVSTSATSPMTVSSVGSYRIWDGATFLFSSTNIKSISYASNTGLSVTWNRVVDVASYRLFYKQGDSVSSSDNYVTIDAATASVDANGDIVYNFIPSGGLTTTPGTKYSFFLRAYDSNNSYHDSNTKTFTFIKVTITGTPASGEELTAQIDGEFKPIESLQTLSWYFNGSLKGSGTTYTVPNQVGTVLCRVEGADFSSGTSHATSVETLVAFVPTISSISNNNRVISIGWTCDGAHGYDLYLVNGQTMTLVSQNASSATSATYTASAAGTYSFVVKAKAADVDSVYDHTSATGSITLGDDPMSVVVMNADASGFNSFAFILKCAVDGNIILFDPSLAGSLITLPNITRQTTSFEIRGLVDANGEPNITLRRYGSNYRPFSIYSSVVISDVIIADGIAYNYGGAVLLGTEAQGSFTNCKFTGNRTNTSSTGYGSVVYVDSDATAATFTNCVFTGNGDSTYKAQTVCLKAPATFTNCTFSSNIGVDSVSDMYIQSGSATLINCSFTSAHTYNIKVGSEATLNLNGGNNLANGLYLYGTLNNAGYNGCGTYFTYQSSTAVITGSGFLAMMSNASITVPETITRSVYGAGVSNLMHDDVSSLNERLKWSSSSSGKTVLLEKQNGSSWTMISASASSPTSVTEEGTYRIWDGATFLTTDVTILPPQTLIVTNTNDSGDGSLRDVLAAARLRDMVTFDSTLAGETITLASGLTKTIGAKIVGLVDNDGDPAITISGNNNAYRILYCSSGPVVLSNLVFVDGLQAVKTDKPNGSSFTNCVFRNNRSSAAHGGAVYLYATSSNYAATDLATFTDCVFTNNATFSSMSYYGGALAIFYCGCVLTRCSFTGNNAYGHYGGAVYFTTNTTAQTLTMTDCAFSGNSITTRTASSATDAGGAVFGRNIVALRCTFENNSIGNQYNKDYGGAVYLNGGASSFTDCVFSGNSAKYFGGAVVTSKSGVSATFTNCTFSGNSVTYDTGTSLGNEYTQGGAIAVCEYASVSCSNCTFSNNSSPFLGGACAVAGSTLALENCVFSGSQPVDISLFRYYNVPVLTLRGGVDLKAGVTSYTSSTSYNPTFNLTGYNGVNGYTCQGGGVPTVSGSGFLALPTDTTITLPADVTRTVYGAGISDVSSLDVVISWSSVDSTKTVLLEKQDGTSWSTVNVGASSPATVVDDGVYRIWDGSTFLTNTVTFIPRTLLVTNTNDSGAGSLRAAVVGSRANDTIMFDSSLAGGTITLASALEITNAVHIVGLTDAMDKPAITISGDDSYRILGGDYAMTLSNLVFVHGGNRAIYSGDAAGSSFTNCVFRSNSVTDKSGGAVAVSGTNGETGSVSFTDCVFASNTAVKSTSAGMSGALLVQYLDCILTRCSFSENVATGSAAGALYYYASDYTLTMTDCIFEDNSVSQKNSSTGSANQGGAIVSSGTLVALRCTFEDNSVGNRYDGDYGGAIYQYGDATFTNCAFARNSTQRYGGCCYLGGGSTTFSNCSFTSNGVAYNNAGVQGTLASQGGAIMATSTALVSCENCTFTNNTSAQFGSSCSVHGGSLSLSSCVFTGGGANKYDVYLCGHDSGSVLTLSGSDDLSAGVLTYALNSSYKATINLTGYNGAGGYVEQSGGSSVVTGSGFLALPTTATISLPNTVTRTEYGAGISSLVANDDTVTWTSVDSTKTVLLEKQNSDLWTMEDVAVSSPLVLDYSGLYRIWDGSTFLSTTVTVVPRTLVVTNADDSGTGSLRAILGIARNDDIVTFDSSLLGETIELESELLVNKRVTITGLVASGGGPGITLDGGTSNNRPGCRCLHATSTFTMSNIAIANGLIAVDSTNLNSDYSTNEYGAGLFCDYSSATSSVATLNNCVFTKCLITGLASFVYAHSYGMAFAIQNGTARLTDCTFGGDYDDYSYYQVMATGYSRANTFRGLVYGDDATVALTRCVNHVTTDLNPSWFSLYFDDCDLNFTDVDSLYQSLFINGGSLTINNLVTSIETSVIGMSGIDGYGEHDACPGLSSFAVSGYNFLGNIYGSQVYDPYMDESTGGFGTITGSGYIAARNVSTWPELPNTIKRVNTCLYPSTSGFSGTTGALTWTTNGEVLLEKLVDDEWQYLAIVPITHMPTAYSPFGWPPVIPDTMWAMIPDPADPTMTVYDPQAPMIPNPNGPNGWDVSPETVTYAIETDEPTTYRIWDGVHFLTTTIYPAPETPQIAVAYTAPNTITATWADTQYEVSYKLTVVKTGFNGATTIVDAASIAANSTSYVLTNVDPNYRYDFAFCAVGTLNDAETTTASLAVTTFTGGGQTIRSGATLTTAIGYGANLGYSWSGTASSETSSTHVVTTADITSGHEIIVTATAGARTVIVDANGAVLQSVTATFLPDAVALGELSVAFNNNGGLNLSWSDTENESSYTLSCRTNNATLAKTSFTNSDVVSGLLSTTTNNNLSAGLYAFELTATNDAGVSTVSASYYLATLSTTGVSVGGYTNIDTLRATLNYGAAVFRWYLGSVAAANLVYETSEAVLSSTLDLTSSTMESVLASGLKIIVVATPAANTTILGSSSAEFYPAAATTPDITAVYNRRYRSVTLSWQDSPNESSYTLSVLSGAATLNGSSSVVLPRGTTTYTTDPGLDAGTYSFGLVATNDSGNATSKATSITTSLESLTFVVTNTNDSGPGSLREAVANAVDGDLIVFDSTLEGETITLTEPLENAESGIIEIRGLVDADGNPAITLSAATANDVIFTTDNADLTFSNIKFGPGKVCVETDATVTCSGVVVFDTLEHTSDFELVVNGYVGIASSSSGTSQSSIDFSGTGTVAAGALESDCGDQAALEVSGLTVTTYGAGISNFSSAFTLQGYVLRWVSVDTTKNVLLEKLVDGDWVAMSTSATPPTSINETTTYRIWDGETFLLLPVTIVNYTIYNESRCNVNIGYVLSSIKAGNSGTANVVGYIQ